MHCCGTLEALVDMKLDAIPDNYTVARCNRVDYNI